MIRFALRCHASHEFDSWFKDGAAFDRMAAAGLVECPHCGSASVQKALMAPRILKERPEPALPAKPPAPVAGGAVPAQVMAMLQRLRAEVERNCDYVGRDFAEEARRIREGEGEQRGIYGEATPEEAEALREDGIEVASLPWVPRADG